MASVPVTHPYYLYIVGANCFQHAVGYSGIILKILKSYNEQDAFGFHMLYPGYGKAEIRTPLAPQADYKAAIDRACVADGFIDCGNELVCQQGYRTVASAFQNKSGINDFHFAFLNTDGMWEAKLAVALPKTSKEITDVLKGYVFDRYWLVPEDYEPGVIRVLPHDDYRLEVEATGTFLNLHVFQKEKGLCFHNAAYLFSNKEMNRMVLGPLNEEAPSSQALTNLQKNGLALKTLNLRLAKPYEKIAKNKNLTTPTP